mgnify:CR=1 FL=1
MIKFLNTLDYYILIIYLFSILGIISFFKLPKKSKAQRINKLLVGSLILVLFYESLAYYHVSLHAFNGWVYLIFFHHIALYINMFIVQEFVLKKTRKWIIRGFIFAHMIFSGIPLLLGYIPINDNGEYSTMLGAPLIIISCWIFFYELVLADGYLEIKPIRFSGFWLITCLLFFYSGSFMILISFSYLIENYLDIYYVVIQVTRSTALIFYACCFLSLANWKGLFLTQTPISYE